MTTLQRVSLALSRFEDRSPRDAYRHVCEEMGIHCQRTILELLSETPRAFHHVRVLLCNQCILGVKGCKALLPIITCSQTCRRLSFRGCGISDDFVQELCEVVQDHQSVRSIDIGDNPLVTVMSAPPVVKLLATNKNVIYFYADGTHIGENVASIISSLGLRNLREMSAYYEDNFFKMKDLFHYLDGTGEGWVALKSIVLNTPYPALQQQLIERIATKKPKRRSDQTIAVDTFMQLVYLNYKTEAEIGQHAAKPVDEPYVLMIANWKKMLLAMETFADYTYEYEDEDETNVDGGECVKIVEPPEEFHRFRIREFLLTTTECRAVVTRAVALTTAELAAEDPQYRGGHTVKIRISALLSALRMCVSNALRHEPRRQLFREVDDDYIPQVLRSGSRMLSMSNVSFMKQTVGGLDDNNSVASSRITTLVDPADLPHTWSLPSSLVKLIVRFFNEMHAKQKKRAPSVIPDTPRTSKDKAMEKSKIFVTDFLKAEFVSEFERLRPALLADMFAKHALPIEDSFLTLPEIVNCLDEYYAQVGVDKVIPLEKIVSMEDVLPQHPDLEEKFRRSDDLSDLDGSVSQPIVLENYEL